MAYTDDIDVLDEVVTSLELEVTTVKAGDAASGDNLFVNVVFRDGTRLYEPFNHEVGEPPDRGESRRWSLPLPAGLNRIAADVAEVYVRKDGDNGWFVGSLLLFFNGLDVPLIGNRHANQFLDYDDDVLRLREWSTESFCVAQATEAKHPLLPSGYRILGPVLGQVTADSAVVLYRVDREGHYRFRAVDPDTGMVVADEIRDLEPTGRFELTGLQPRNRYEFDLTFLRADGETPVPNAAGSVVTYPEETQRGKFTFAFGSCANPNEQKAQGAWTAIRAAAVAPGRGVNPVRLFVHLGDSFYFYDHMIEEEVSNVESMHAAHVSMRRHPEFLDMARVVPCCGVWDDHDFAYDNTDGSDVTPGIRAEAVDTYLQYWGNAQPIDGRHDLGISTRITYGLVDLYLLDGRFFRNPDGGAYFGPLLIADLLDSIQERGGDGGRVVVLATGSNWNHEADQDRENYNHPDYAEEREHLFSSLADLMGHSIQGLLLLSGDDHRNEIFHVQLGGGRIAPEFVSSPLTLNTGLLDEPNDLSGERVGSFPTSLANGRRGFATLTIDTSNSDTPATATVRYHQEAAGIVYEERDYVLTNGQFTPL